MNNPRVLKSRGETGRIPTARPIINLKYEACKKGIEPLPAVLETDALPIELLASIIIQIYSIYFKYQNKYINKYL